MTFQEQLEAVRVELARRHLLDFTRYTKPDYDAGWFQREVCGELDRFLEQVEQKQSPRLIVMAPPRSGKTEIVSRRFPAFAMGRNPDLTVIATSYAAELASMNNRDVQRIIDDQDGRYAKVFPETKLNASNIRTVAQGTFLRNSDIFEIVGRRGVYRSAGVGGGITGMGGNICIVDDPIKDDKEATSETIRESVWNWYSTTLYTRLAPGGGVLVIMTRWHEDDLVGRLLKQNPTGWRVLRYPAIAEEDEKHRKKGEALHETRFSTRQMEGIRRDVGSRTWISLYQQRPTAAEGQILKRENWRYFKPTSDDREKLLKDLGITYILQTWDTAFKEKSVNDPSATLTIGVAATRYYLLDGWAGRVEYPEMKREVAARYAKWKPHMVLVEDKASGQSLIQEMKRDARIPIIPFTPDRDKVARANMISPQLEAGLVWLPEGASWVADFVDECAAFPNGTHDDQVDALTMGLQYLIGGGAKMGLLEFYRLQAERMEVMRDAGAGSAAAAGA